MSNKNKNMICPQCGSNEFVDNHKNLQCAYCKTVFTPEILKKSTSKNEKKRNHKKLKVRTIALLGIILILSMTGIVKQYSIFKNLSSKDTSKMDDQKIGMNNISSINGWNKKIYTGIKIASLTSYKDTLIYTSGTKFDDLVKEVGRPTKIEVRRSSQKTVGEATFSTNKISDFKVHVFITYDQESRYITDKAIYGRELTFSSDFNNKNIEDLFSIGWTKEKYDKLIIATTLIDRSNNRTAYEGGAQIDSLLKTLPEPYEIRRETDEISKNRLRYYTWKPKSYVFVRITVDEASGQIIQKNIE